VTVVEIDPRIDSRWAALAAGSHGSLFHSPPWLRALASTYGWSPIADLVLDDDGAPVAGCAWCPVDDLEPRIVSLPFSDYAGPLGAPAHHAGLLERRTRPEVAVRWRTLSRAPGTAPDPPEERARAAGVARWHGIVVDDLDAHAARMQPAARRAVRKARDAGLDVVTATDDASTTRFLALHTRVRRVKYGLLPQPLAFFDALRTEFETGADPSVGWFPLEARLEGRTIAVTLYLRWGDTLYYKFNASETETLAARPNDLLLRAGVELAAELGCRLVDLGASDDDQPGLIRFKRGHGGEEGEIRSWRAGPPPGPDAAHAARVLHTVTGELTAPDIPDDTLQQAGALLYRYFA
jgi:hypothetical protein